MIAYVQFTSKLVGRIYIWICLMIDLVNFAFANKHFRYPMKEILIRIIGIQILKDSFSSHQRIHLHTKTVIMKVSCHSEARKIFQSSTLKRWGHANIMRKTGNSFGSWVPEKAPYTSLMILRIRSTICIELDPILRRRFPTNETCLTLVGLVLRILRW